MSLEGGCVSKGVIGDSGQNEVDSSSKVADNLLEIEGFVDGLGRIAGYPVDPNGEDDGGVG